MKRKCFFVLCLVIVVGTIVWAKTSSKDNFSQAKDFPKGALVYLQTGDLPELIRLWDESKLKEKYLQSENFRVFQNSHLGIKLAERFRDFSDYLGFQVELQTLGTLAEAKAALAIYDVGKLDFVFVAPMSETIFLASIIAQNSSRFEELELENGTTFYRIGFKVDRGRQEQTLIFANIRGRFVLATGEGLFLRTISAIDGRERLYDEASFRKLSYKVTPNLVTIWINQETVNNDYYFKRYWLLSDVADLQNIRAGIFDLNLTEKDLIEKREFLLKEPRNSAPVPISESRNLISHIPENVPLLRIKKADENQPGETIYKTFFDPQIVKITHRSYSTSWSYSSPDAYYEKERDYLDSDFEKDVNRVENEETVRTKYFQPNKISNSLTPANPTSILTATSPKMVKDSPFIEFRKIAIISLKNPDSFHSNLFENSIIEALQNRVTVTNTNFVWETKEGLRKLNVPMLGWELGYRLKDGKLFVSNSLQFLGECISGGNNSQLEAQHFSDLTIIRNRNRSEIFDDPMRKLEIEKWDFFTGNVSSLLDLAADVRQIEIRRITKNNLLSEEVSVRIDSGK